MRLPGWYTPASHPAVFQEPACYLYLSILRFPGNAQDMDRPLLQRRGPPARSVLCFPPGPIGLHIATGCPAKFPPAFPLYYLQHAGYSLYIEVRWTMHMPCPTVYS